MLAEWALAVFASAFNISTVTTFPCYYYRSTAVVTSPFELDKNTATDVALQFGLRSAEVISV